MFPGRTRYIVVGVPGPEKCRNSRDPPDCDGILCRRIVLYKLENHETEGFGYQSDSREQRLKYSFCINLNSFNNLLNVDV